MILALGLLVACGRPAAVQPEPQLADAGPAAGAGSIVTAVVPARAETVVADNPAVDADDPALWADPSDPSRALLFGTDKSKGLYVHDLAGQVRQFFPDGPMNNVDLRDFAMAGRPMVLVAAAERDRFGIMTWRFDPADLKVERWGFLPTDRSFGEPYGFCMGQWRGETFLVANNKAGEVRAFVVSEAAGGGPAMREAHRWKLASQTEGCVVDDATGDLYVGEEDVGIWRMSLARPGEAPVKIAAVDNRILVADVEGLTILRDGGRSYLIASSQGDSAYAVFERTGGGHRFVGRFRISGGGIDPVTHTDGISAWSGPIAGFPQGAIAVHDHCDGDGPDDPPAGVCDSEGKQQNYKLVDWRDVKRALGIG